MQKFKIGIQGRRGRTRIRMDSRDEKESEDERVRGMETVRGERGRGPGRREGRHPTGKR